MRKKGKRTYYPKMPEKHFSISAYLDRINRAALVIEQEKEPVDQTIILWWGLEGIKLNSDGSIESVSRKKPKSDPKRGAPCVCSCAANNTVFYADNQPVFQSAVLQGFAALQSCYYAISTSSILPQSQQCCSCYHPDWRTLCNAFGAGELMGK